MEALYRKENPAFDAASKRSEEVAERYLDPISRLLVELEAKIKGMNIATRFRRDKQPNFEYVYGVNPTLVGLNEADFKRGQLLSDIHSLMTAHTRTIGMLDGLIMDMEATKTEDDGTQPPLKAG